MLKILYIVCKLDQEAAVGTVVRVQFETLTSFVALCPTFWRYKAFQSARFDAGPGLDVRGWEDAV